MTLPRPPICVFCKNRITPETCEAFPEGIPKPILENERDHREPFKGDDGIRFDPESGQGTRYAKSVFG